MSHNCETYAGNNIFFLSRIKDFFRGLLSFSLKFYFFADRLLFAYFLCIFVISAPLLIVFRLFVKTANECFPERFVQNRSSSPGLAARPLFSDVRRLRRPDADINIKTPGKKAGENIFLFS